MHFSPHCQSNFIRINANIERSLTFVIVFINFCFPFVFSLFLSLYFFAFVIAVFLSFAISFFVYCHFLCSFHYSVVLCVLFLLLLLLLKLRLHDVGLWFGFDIILFVYFTSCTIQSNRYLQSALKWKHTSRQTGTENSVIHLSYKPSPNKVLFTFLFLILFSSLFLAFRSRWRSSLVQFCLYMFIVNCEYYYSLYQMLAMSE